MDFMKRQTLKIAFRDMIPVMTGYLFLGCGFGILLNETGYGLWWSLAMAVFMYAGSAQFLAVSLLANHVDLLSAAVATLLLNARHLFYGISLIDTYKNTGFKKPYLIFALTDETYSLVTQNQPPEGVKKSTYCFLVTLFDHIYWITGCALGSLLGTAIPMNFKGIDFVLTALFVTMFVEQWLSNTNHRPALIGVMSTILALLIFGKEIFLIPAMVLIAILLVISRKTARRDVCA
jgi:4-azaleucine resistance transporter AzlC